jgi:hypothetical protein
VSECEPSVGMRDCKCQDCICGCSLGSPNENVSMVQGAVWTASRVDTWQRVLNSSDDTNSLMEVFEYGMNTM